MKTHTGRTMYTHREEMASGEIGPAHTLISDFWPPELEK